jgi:predicted 2-oxoglutarate/Fe(II)-dependent dioxygenase YbiX
VALLPSVDHGERPVRRTAVPLLIVDDVVDATLRDDLLGAAGGWRPSPVVRPDGHGQPSLVTDVDAKARLDRVLDGELAARVVAAVERRLLPEVVRGLAHTPRSFEAVKLVRYEAGRGWFTVHRDNTTPDAVHRRLAVTINLDDGYDGGDLTFPELGPDRYRPRPGAAIVFSCGLLHEVTSVRTGTRHALVTFLW